MTDDRRTKAQIVAELERCQEIAEGAKTSPEAAALDGCVKALRGLPKVRKSHTFNRDYEAPDSHAVERILSHLAAMYGVRDGVSEVAEAERREQRARQEADELRLELDDLRESLRSLGVTG